MTKTSERFSSAVGLFLGLFISYLGIQAFINSTHTINQIRILLMVGIVCILVAVWQLYINRIEKTKNEKIIIGLLSLITVISVFLGIR